MMVKIIRLKKNEFIPKSKFNNIFFINDALALAKGFVFLNNLPRRRALRKNLLSEYNQNPHKKIIL